MSSLPDYPSYSNGTLSLNGQVKATTSKNGDTVNSNYNLSDFEKLALQYAQETLANQLPNINVFSPDVIKNINSQVDAFKNSAVKEINSTYEPMLTNLKNDIASRFGSFSNSVFMNNLNNIESQRASAIASLAEDVASKRSELESQELAKRYEYLNFLNDYQNNLYSNILNSVSSTQTNSSLGNSYSSDYANYLYKQKLADDQEKYKSTSFWTSLLKMLG